MTAKQALDSLQAKSLRLAVAESLTGGGLSSEFVSVPGASKVFLGAIVAYDTAIKASLLGVPQVLLSERGAVDPEVAVAMARGVRGSLAKAANLPEDSVVGLAVTGVAGPDSQDGKSVGTVFVAILGASGVPVEVTEYFFGGSREQIRAQSTEAAVNVLLAWLQKV